MPGPFPGMDPYLEDPVNWPSVHSLLIAYIWEAIMSALPEGYEANVEDRCYVVGVDRGIIPDVTVHPVVRTGIHKRASVADPDEPLLFRVGPVEVHETYIHIYRKGNHARVITAIELLSPANKGPNTAGRRAYIEKQGEVGRSQTHLLEIDLLRGGDHTVAIPLDAIRPIRRWDYIVCLDRFLWNVVDVKREFAVWLRTLRERLPVVAVPLDQGDPDIVLDVQAVVNRYYDAGRFATRIDYSQEPYPLLDAEDRVWADALLREKGLRA